MIHWERQNLLKDDMRLLLEMLRYRLRNWKFQYFLFSNSVVGESSLDRFTCALGGKTILPHIINIVPSMLQHGECFDHFLVLWLRRWIPNPGVLCSNHWVAPRSTQPIILPRLIKWVPGISGNLVAKSKLLPRSGCSLQAVEPNPQKGAIRFLKFLWGQNYAQNH